MNRARWAALIGCTLALLSGRFFSDLRRVRLTLEVCTPRPMQVQLELRRKDRGGLYRLEVDSPNHELWSLSVPPGRYALTAFASCSLGFEEAQIMPFCSGFPLEVRETGHLETPKALSDWAIEGETRRIVGVRCPP